VSHAVGAVVAIGVGASGEAARARVADGIGDVDSALGVVGQSRLYDNPPWGGATCAPFCNAVVVVRAGLPLAALYGVLRAIERQRGRARSPLLKNGARTLDLDVLWGAGVLGGEGASGVILPHPRLRRRGFAVVPLVEALDDAGVVVALSLRAAAADRALRPPLSPISLSAPRAAGHRRP